MKHRIYALERAALDRLLSDRSELLLAARSLKSAAELRAARADLMASASINYAPTADHPLRLDVRDGVAHIPIAGELTPTADPCGAFMGEAVTEYGFILAALAEAEARDDVSSIALEVDSPGGYVFGVDQVAQAIASVSKPVTAYVGDMAASAAYWLSSQADRIIATSPVSRVGSIGVAREEYDDRAQLEREGIAHRVYTSTDAPDKRVDTATDEGRAKVVAELDAVHEIFVRRVSEGRHVSADTVNKSFGRGGVFTAEKALAVGMIDEVLGGHLSRPVPPASTLGVAESATATPSAKIQSKESNMDEITKLKAESPEIVAALHEEGVKAERKRREDLLTLRGNNAEGDKAVEAAIASGAAYADAMPVIMAATLKGTGGDNPPLVTTAIPESGSGADSIPGLSVTDIAALKKAGLSMDEIKANAPKGKE